VVEKEAVRSLLDTVERRVARLERARGTPPEEYLADRDLQDIVERNFELAVQACITLGVHLLADQPAAPPDTNRAVFGALHREGLLDAELADRLEAMAGFRNVLAHEYASVNPELVHEHLARLDDIREFAEALVPELRERGGLE